MDKINDYTYIYNKYSQLFYFFYYKNTLTHKITREYNIIVIHYYTRNVLILTIAILLLYIYTHFCFFQKS